MPTTEQAQRKTQKASGRRAEYAAQTRSAIEAAARTLFAEQGFFGTRVEDIATRARVAPATVYAVCGGKQGLLRTLAEAWTYSPIVDETDQHMKSAADADAILRLSAEVTAGMREKWGDVMRVVLAAAPHDAAAAESLSLVVQRNKRTCVTVAERLRELGALRAELSTEEAADILWFYFGFSSYITLLDDNGWSLDRARHWLHTAARDALL